MIHIFQAFQTVQLYQEQLMMSYLMMMMMMRMVMIQMGSTLMVTMVLYDVGLTVYKPIHRQRI